MNFSFPPDFFPRLPSRLPLHLMKSSEVKPTGQGGSQPRAGSLRTGTGYMSADGTNVSIGVTLGHRAVGQEALFLPQNCACRSSLGQRLRRPQRPRVYQVSVPVPDERLWLPSCAMGSVHSDCEDKCASEPSASLTGLASCVPSSSVPPTDRKPPTPTSVPTPVLDQSVCAPSACSYLETTTSSHAKIPRHISLGDSEGPVTTELSRSLHKPLSLGELASLGQEPQAVPTTVTLTSSLGGQEPAVPSWGNHEARASLKLSLSSVCGQLLTSPPLESPTTCVRSQEPVNVQPGMAVTVASLQTPSPVDVSTLRLHSSVLLPKTSASGPLTPPGHPNNLQLLETRSRLPGSTTALLEPIPGEYCRGVQ